MFLDGVDLGANIARNQALKENVFMMVICIELRIPLFLVGKPGSSKSLAKTIVADAMQGEAARTHIFRLLKSVCKTCGVQLQLLIECPLILLLHLSETVHLPRTEQIFSYPV